MRLTKANGWLERFRARRMRGRTSGSGDAKDLFREVHGVFGPCGGAPRQARRGEGVQLAGAKTGQESGGGLAVSSTGRSPGFRFGMKFSTNSRHQRSSPAGTHTFSFSRLAWLICVAGTVST